MTRPRDYAAEYARRRVRLKRQRGIETPAQRGARRLKDRARRAAHTLIATGNNGCITVVCTTCGPLEPFPHIDATALARMQAAHRRDLGVS